MVFFAFHQYLALNLHWNNFFSGNYISVRFATWNDASIYLVSNILQVILVFTFCGCLYYARKKPQYFTFMARKSFTKTKVQAFFYKFFEKFNNGPYLWKKRLKRLKQRQNTQY